MMGPQPHSILVGVDLGLTCTGVALSSPDWNQIGIIQDWPGNTEVVNKVPTSVEYRAGNRKFKSWGFQCPMPREVQRGRDVKDLFKLYLDENILKETFEDNEDVTVGEYEDVRNWYTDFLKALYQYIGKYLKVEYKVHDWRNYRVEFLFSYPTTWNDAVVARFEEVVSDAGFGSEKNHSVTVHLTEAAAAAVYTADSSRQPDPSSTFSEDCRKVPSLKIEDIILVCDSGGGTTDIAVVKVTALKDIDEPGLDQNVQRLAELEPLDNPCGLAIGSVQIDDEFREIIRNRLDSARTRYSDINVDDAVIDNIVKGDFQTFKRSVGILPALPKFKIPIHGLDKGLELPEFGIEGGRMIFTLESLQGLFDSKLDRIKDLINSQLEAHSEEQVTHLVLSGGLCSSPYVQQTLRDTYGKRMEILVAKDPQLAVCKGLVIERLHQLRYSNFILPFRKTIYSYGIISNVLYNSRKHQEQRQYVKKDPVDGKEYITDQIRWVIYQGKAINRAIPVKRRFYCHVDSIKGELVWQDEIATSIAPPPPTRLPKCIHDGDASRICEIVSKLVIDNPVEFEKKGLLKKKQVRNRLGVRTGKAFWRIELDLLVWVLRDDLKFEIQFAGRTVGSQVISVDYELVRDPSKDEDHETSSEEWVTPRSDPVQRDYGQHPLQKP